MSENPNASKEQLDGYLENNKINDFIVSKIEPKDVSFIHSDTKIIFDDKFYFGDNNNNLTVKHYLFSYYRRSNGLIKFEKEIVSNQLPPLCKISDF